MIDNVTPVFFLWLISIVLIYLLLYVWNVNLKKRFYLSVMTPFIFIVVVEFFDLADDINNAVQGLFCSGG